MLQTDGTWTIVVSKCYFLSLFISYSYNKTFILSLLTAPLVFIQLPPILLDVATAPLIRSSAHKVAVPPMHFEKHWFSSRDKLELLLNIILFDILLKQIIDSYVKNYYCSNLLWTHWNFSCNYWCFVKVFYYMSEINRPTHFHHTSHVSIIKTEQMSRVTSPVSWQRLSNGSKKHNLFSCTFFSTRTCVK